MALAKYVKAGNIEKHCTASIIGQYSKKFSGSSNKGIEMSPYRNSFKFDLVNSIWIDFTKGLEPKKMNF